jgi:glucokinase
MAEARYASLDIGGTKIAYALLGEDGRVLRRYPDRQTPGKWGKLSGCIIGAVEEAADGGRLDGIGVSVAGPVTDDGTVVETANMEFPPHFQLRGYLEGAFRTGASVENDARCFALGVHRHELKGRYKDVVCLTLGTGLGGAVIIDGGLEPRPRDQSEEIGHALYKEGGLVCGCGRKGCNEAYVSGTAIENRYSLMSGKKATAKEIAGMKDRFSRQLMNAVRGDFSVILDRLVGRYGPEAIILGGSVAPVFDGQKCSVPLLRSGLADASLLGAVVPLLSEDI